MGYAQSPANSAYNFGTGDFTGELWMYWTSYSCSGSILGTPTDTVSNWSLGPIQGKPILEVNNSTGTVVAASVQSPAALALNTWHHLAVSRQAGLLRLFVNGAEVASAPVPISTEGYSSTLPLSIGNAGGGGNGCRTYTVYENDLRLTKGVARYTGNFTPPQAAFKTN
jgi:hypothetical protein